MRDKLILIVSGLVLAVAGFFYWRQSSFPVYREGEQPSARANFVMNTLTWGDTVYVSDYTEFPLQPESLGWTNQIGKSDKGMQVYAIYEQSPQNYIALSGYMFPPLVYRNRQLAPINLAQLQVSEIQFLTGEGVERRFKKTLDKALIEDVLGRLVNPGQVKSAQGNYHTDYIRLFSSQFKGMVYHVYVVVDENKQVYLAEALTPEQWIPAGEQFASWVAK